MSPAARSCCLQHMIKAVVRPGEQSGYVAECVEIPVVTQGRTLDETISNLREAAQLHLEGEDLAAMGLSTNPTVIVTMELEPLPTVPALTASRIPAMGLLLAAAGAAVILSRRAAPCGAAGSARS